MKRFYFLFLAVIASCFYLQAQQFPNSDFEQWDAINYWGDKFSSGQEPKGWHGSHVSKEAAGVVVKEAVTSKAAGRSGGSSVLVQNIRVGAAGIYENTPGYFALGTPWQYLKGLDVNNATGGTSGGLNFTYRPDSIEVWIRRQGDHIKDENFNILFYSWKGTSKASQYQGKSGACASVDDSRYNTNEESDIRQALDANKCGTDEKATQVAEAWVKGNDLYEDWTKLVIPIYYMTDDVPEKCNMVFASSGYPNFRVASGIYEGNGLLVDDVRLIYSSKIEHLYIGGKEWKGFNKDVVSPNIQTYSVGNVSSIPQVEGRRGVGKLTNLRGTTANFAGRKLTSQEMTIVKQGQVDGDPMEIQVKAEDGSSTTTYLIQFVSKQSNNSRLASILINDEPLSGFNGYLQQYNVELPYGTTATPKVSYEKAEDAQDVKITQPTSTTGTATIVVTAQDGKTQSTYTLKFSVAQLSDNTLADILVDGESLNGFVSTKRNYTVELPLGTTAAPKITWKSAYKTGEQTITLVSNTLDGGAQISVKVPGNTKENIYKLTYKITASTYSYLKDLRVGGKTVDDFMAEKTDYYISLPMGTTTLPAIDYTQGDQYQTVSVDKKGVDETTRITVTAASGAQTIYRLNFSVLKSSNSQLKAIMLDGKMMDGFDPDVYEYTIALGTGATAAPKITYTQGDDYQTVTVRDGGLTGTTRVIVTAGDGSTQTYTIRYSVTSSTVNTLKMIYVGGKALDGFAADKLEYDYQLPQGTTSLPAVTFDKGDEAQTVTTRTFSGLTGDYKLAVKPQSGATQTYIIHFSVLTSSNTTLKMIYLDGSKLDGFSSSQLSYSLTLPMGTTTLPTITWDVADASQRVILTDGVLNGTASQLRVIAGDGSSSTYSLSFVVPIAGVSTLLDLKVGGQTVEGFAPDKTEYTISLPQGTTTLPLITYTPNDEFQTIRKTEGGVNGDTRIVVRAQNGSTTTYVLHFSVNKSSNALLANILVGGKSLSGFAPEVFDYDTVLPSSVSRVPNVTCTKGESSQTISIQNGSFSTPTVIRVTAEDGTTRTYTISFSQEHSENAYLNMIYLDSVALPGFQSSRLEYSYNLELEATRCPVITVDKNDGQRVSITTPALTGTASIVVEPETGEKNTYTIRFTQAASTNSQLRSISLDGQLIPDWNPEITEYNIVLSSTVLPKVSYELGDEYQRVYLTEGTLTEKTYLKVVAADDTYTVYSIAYALQTSTSDVNSLTDITLNGRSLIGFDAEQSDYSYQLSAGETAAPTISARKADPSETIIIVQPSSVGEATIEVMAGNESSKTYTVNIESTLSSNSELAGLSINGEDIALQPSVHSYSVDLPDGTTSLPTINATAGDQYQQIKVINNSLYSPAFVKVTAQDGSSTLYTINYQLNPSALSTLADLRIGGQSIVGFDPNTLAYNYQLPRGSAALGEVSAVKGHPAQTVSITMPQREGQGTVKVVAEDGQTTTVYTINVSVEMSSNAELSSLSVNGNEIRLAGVYDYTVSIPAFSVPELHYQAGDAMQTIGVVDNGDKGATIIVTAEDGQKTNVYTINYTQIPSSDATLSDLLVFNGVEYESIFSAQTTDYNYQLAWRTRQVPSLWPVAHAKGQTIEVDYGAVNQTTTITVKAQDGTTKTYTVFFEVEKSKNAQLEDVVCELGDVNFAPQTNDYLIELPYGTTVAPMLSYVKQEEEQKVIYTYASIDKTSTIKVVAEDGTENTYSFRFTVPYSDKPNTLPTVMVNGIGYALGDNTGVDIPLPYGTKKMEVSVPTTNFEEQTYEIVNGGLYQPTTITVYAHRDDEPAKVYTLNPKLETTYPTALTSITIDGVELSGFEKDKHSYVLSVADEPTTVTAVAYNSNMQVDAENLVSTKMRRIAVEDPNGEWNTSYYDIYFYYPNDLTFDLSFDQFDKVSNTLKGAGVLDMSKEAREKVGLIDCNSTEIRIGDFKDDTHSGVVPRGWNSPITAATTGLKNKDDMGHIRIGIKPFCTGLINLNISTFIGNQINDYDPENYVTQNSSVKLQGASSAQLSTRYITTSAESLPAVLSLSKQSVSIGMWMLDGAIEENLGLLSGTSAMKDLSSMLAAASAPTTLTFGEPITFRNSPDRLTMMAKPQSHQKIESWSMSYVVNGETAVKYEGSYASAQWIEIDEDIAYNDNPITLDIRINSAHTEIPHDTYVKQEGQEEENQYRSTLIVDNLQLYYNSELTGLKVNGLAADKSGDEFSITLDGETYYGKPVLEFEKGVPDQMPTVTWNTDYTEATIVNMAEDCDTKTEYKLTINRQLSADNTLKSVILDGSEWTAFDPAKTEYTITYDDNQPSLQVLLSSIRSTAVYSRAADVTTIVVKAENGDEKTYTFTYQKNTKPVSADASFVATKIDGKNSQTETFVTLQKAYDEQEIVFDETLGTIVCTASDATTTSTKAIADFKETVVAVPTSAQLQRLSDGEGVMLQGFDAATLNYTEDYGTLFSFTRRDAGDKVVVTITDTQTQLSVKGSGAAVDEDNARFTYLISTPEPTTDNPYLADIKINGVSFADFYETEEEYVINDLNAKIEPVRREDGQTVSITYIDGEQKKMAPARKRMPKLVNGIKGTYIIKTTSSDLSKVHEIYIYLKYVESADARLAALGLDGQSLTPSFNPDIFQYEVTIPVAEPKTEEATMPGITAIAGANGQNIVIEDNGLGNTSYVIVTAENGTEQQYELTVNAQPSSYCKLGMIEVNGSQVELVDGVVEYDVVLKQLGVPTVEVSSPDIVANKNILKSVSQTSAQIEVTAENGDMLTYTLNFSYHPSLTDATLKNILIDGKTLKDINGDLFQSDIYDYEVVMPCGTTTMPIVNIVKKYDEQIVSTYPQILSSYPQALEAVLTVDVASSDNMNQQTYTIHFTTAKSGNCRLAGLSLNYEPLAGFSPYQTTYTVELLSPDFEVQYVRGDENQTVVIDTQTEGKILIDVTSEDLSCTTHYQIDYTIYHCSLSTLSNILLDGVGLVGFEPEKTAYQIVLPMGVRTIPDIAAIAACDGQKIEYDIRDISEPSVITVTSADDENTTSYSLQFIIQLSKNTDLDAITADGEIIDGFRADSIYYEYFLPVGTRQMPELAYILSDVNAQVQQTDVYKTVYRRDTRFQVTAEDGKTRRTYAVIYNVLKSGVDTLSMIYLDDVPLEGFAGKQNTYSVTLPVGTATLPHLTVDKGDEYQQEPVVKTLHTDQMSASYEITACAEDSTLRVYTVDIRIAQSEVCTLRSITVNGVPIEVNGIGYTGSAAFSPEITSYTIEWAVGTPSSPLPQIEAVAGDAYQTIEKLTTLTSLDGTVHFNVTAQNGDMKSYTVNSVLRHSSVDTLTMITLDGVDLEGFRGQTNSYQVELPLGTTSYPQIGYETAEPWQTVEGPKLVASTAYTATYILTVKAEQGNQRTYTVSFSIPRSGNDRLEMIYLNDQLLQEFEPTTNYYTITLPVGSTELPQITWDGGDQWQTQTLLQGQLPGETYIVVTAQAGNTRTYTLHFVVAKSTEAGLSMIYVDGQPVPSFDEELYEYTVELPYGTDAMPHITYDKKEEAQTVHTTTLAWQHQIEVTAEDGQTKKTYTLNYQIGKSDNALLKSIMLDGVLIDGFDPLTFDYDIELPANTTVLPTLSYQQGDEQQSVGYSEGFDSYTIEVVAGDGVTTNTYTINFTIALSGENRLSLLSIDGQLLDGWDPDTLIYHIDYPVGTTIDQLPTIDHLTYVPVDPLSVVSLIQQDSLTMTALVTAQNGDIRVYVIEQKILLSDNSLLRDLRVGGITINGFDPAVLEYVYEIYEGQLPPEVEAEAQDTLAEVAITMGGVGEKTYIYCTAADGSETAYTILFAISDINGQNTPNSSSCYWMHIPGTTQYKAVTISMNVQCAIYDINGQLLLRQEVPMVNPNKVDVGENNQRQQIILTVDPSAEGAIFDIPQLNRAYFYVFFQDDMKICSGKFSLAN